jgi:hypothetical protein
MSDHFGVRLADETSAVQLELLAQLVMVFNDAVVDDRNAPNRVWMRVVLGRAAVSGPACVANAYWSSERPIGKLRLEVLEFSNCAGVE